MRSLRHSYIEACTFLEATASSSPEQTVSSGAETDYPDETVDSSEASPDLTTSINCQKKLNCYAKLCFSETTEAQNGPTLTSTKPRVTGASKVSSGIAKRTSSGPVRAADPKKLKCNTLNAKV